MRARARVFPTTLILLATIVAGRPARAQETIDLPAARDNTLFQSAGGDLSNGAGPVFFVGTTGLVPRRALLRFDVAGTIPAGAVITDVTLILQLSAAPNPNAAIIGLYRIAHDWGEGTSSTSSSAGAPATAGDATWLNTSYPGALWSSAGGDFSSTVSSAHAVSGLGFHAWAGGSMIADVQAWLDDPSHDFGWLMKGDEVANNTARTFASREDATLFNRPKLRVTYDAPIVVRGSSWSRLKRLYR